MSFTSFEDADKIVSRFIELLSKHGGITPKIGSQIEDEFLSPMQLLELTKNFGAQVNKPELLAQAGGMYDLAAKLLAIETQPEFATFIPHLKLFEAKTAISTVVQPNNADPSDDVNRKLVELYLGSLVVHFGLNVQLDHPVHSKGDNPDVMFEVHPDGLPASQWALAIKTVSTGSGQTLFENIEKAAKQIDAQACPANRGMVVINLKNSIQHKQLWGSVYASLAEAEAALRTKMRVLIDSSKTGRPLSDWEAVFAKRTSPLVFFYCQAVVRLHPPGGQEVAMILKVAEGFNPLRREDVMADHIAYYLNHYMKVILKGIPGAAGQAPA